MELYPFPKLTRKSTFYFFSNPMYCRNQKLKFFFHKSANLIKPGLYIKLQKCSRLKMYWQLIFFYQSIKEKSDIS